MLLLKMDSLKAFKTFLQRVPINMAGPVLCGLQGQLQKKGKVSAIPAEQVRMDS